jgi:hypothetical protein
MAGTCGASKTDADETWRNTLIHKYCNRWDNDNKMVRRVG